MPIYEYRCEQGHTFEVMRRMTDDPLVSCQTCSAPVERVFRPIAVHFKGTGFYNTDYGTRNRSREREAAEAEKKASDSKSSDSKSDSKSTESASTESKSPGASPAKTETKSSSAPAKAAGASKSDR